MRNNPCGSRLVWLLFGLPIAAFSQLSEKKVGNVEGVYYTAIHMDCSKVKVAVCDYEEGVKYNGDGTFEWMISKNKMMESRQVGKFKVVNDTVFHTEVVQWKYAMKPCPDVDKCKENEERKARGEAIEGATTVGIADFSSVVRIKGDGTYRMIIDKTKDVVYWKLR